MVKVFTHDNCIVEAGVKLGFGSCLGLDDTAISLHGELPPIARWTTVPDVVSKMKQIVSVDGANREAFRVTMIIEPLISLDKFDGNLLDAANVSMSK